jgi:hypothetical protein
MPRLPRLPWLLIAVLALWCLTGLCTPYCLAAPAVQGTEVQVFDIPSKASQEDIARVLRFVARNRQWMIEQEEPGYLRISLYSRGTALALAFHYDAAQLKMLCLTRADADKAGRTKRWINNLAQDIRNQLAAKN